jgi:hypothetical protein
MAKGGKLSSEDKVRLAQIEREIKEQQKTIEEFEEDDNETEYDRFGNPSPLSFNQLVVVEAEKNLEKLQEERKNLLKGKKMADGGYMEEGGETAKFEVDDVVYHKGHNTVGIVRMAEERGEVKTDADGNVNVSELEYYNPLKHESHKNAEIAPSTSKEIEERMLWKPFSERASQLRKGGYMAKGGATEHGLKMGDKIVADQFWENTVVVENPKTGRAVVDLENGKRKEASK